MENIETRSYQFELEVREGEENEGVLEGMPIVFNQRTDLGPFDEIIAPEALNECDLTDVRLCLNHDTSYVYARSRNNNEKSSMRLMLDTLGMKVRALLAIKYSPRAQDLWAAVKRGDIDKMSFMFVVGRDEWQDVDTDHPLRIIRAIRKVFECSCVTFPAYEGTSVSARSDGSSLDSALASLDSARAKLAEDRAAQEKAEKRKSLLAELRGETNV